MAGEKTEAEAQEDARESVRAMRYREDKSGYIWIDAKDGTLVMHPILADQEGSNRYDMQDQNGVMITQSVINVCLGPEKGGYNEFTFTKSDGVTVAPKISYSEMFEPWGWVVSTGNYVDEMKQELSEMEKVLDREYKNVLRRAELVFIIVIIIAIVMAFVFGKQIVAPLKKIQLFAE